MRGLLIALVPLLANALTCPANQEKYTRCDKTDWCEFWGCSSCNNNDYCRACPAGKVSKRGLTTVCKFRLRVDSSGQPRDRRDGGGGGTIDATSAR